MALVKDVRKVEKRMVVLSHNPFVPVLVPAELVERQPNIEIENFDGIGAPLTQPSTTQDRRWDRDTGLAKLILQVSHLCNLTCSYCIADAGRWGKSDTSFMSPSIAAQSIRYFGEKYGSIGSVYLFGGEPTLNIEAIEAACDEVERLVEQGILQEMPDVGFTSNGTVLNDKLIRLLTERSYVKMSVSLDGPAALHNYYRLDAAGRPTYDKIIHNVQTMRARTGQPKTLELTYTPRHQESDLSLWEMMKMMREDTGIRIIGVELAYNTSYSHINYDPLLLDIERTLADVDDAITKSMESIATSDDPIYYYHVIAFMQVLFKKHQPNFCPAARNYFTVARDGAVYPCQNLPETPETLIGYLGDADLDRRILDNPVLQLINAANRQAEEKLGEQWFANFCKICPAYNLGETHKMDTLAPSRLKLYERMASAFTTALLTIAENDRMYTHFIKNVTSRAQDTFELNMF